MASSTCTTWCLLRIFFIVALLSRLPAAYAGGVQKVDTVCTVSPSTDGSDDAPAILSAFEQCGHDGSIVFTNDTFHIESVMNTTGLNNVTVDLQGTLLVRSSFSPPFTPYFALTDHILVPRFLSSTCSRIVGHEYYVLEKQQSSIGIFEHESRLGVRRVECPFHGK